MTDMTNEELLYFDLYGCKEDNLDLVKENLDKALDIKMRERDSTYYGRCFSHHTNEDEVIDCKCNWNWDDDKYCSEAHKDYPILVSINGTRTPEVFEQKLKNSKIQFDLLEREQG